MKPFRDQSLSKKTGAIIRTRPSPNKYSNKQMGRQLANLISIALAAGSNTAYAHEYWIEADNYAPEPGNTVALTVRVGQDFVGEEVLNIKDFYSDYSVSSKAGRQPVSGSLATTPPAYITIAETGTYIVGQRTVRSQVKMNPEKFSQYLKKQGLDDALKNVDYSKSDENPITEDYSRCAKAIIRSGTMSETDVLSTALGYTLELIPYSDPARLKAGDTFTVQLRYEDQPMANAQITGLNKHKSEFPVKIRTDNEGYAHITLPYSGTWMLSSVYIIPGIDSDWESFWANLSFSLSR